MMDEVLQKKLRDAVWAAHSLFERGKTSGSSANMSFLHEGNIYITASGSCFGTLTEEDFAVVSLDGVPQNDKKASKELTLHKYYYEKDEKVQAVIHTHGPYAVLWSCRRFDRDEDIIPSYTPYLKMKVGSIGLVPYGKPGSDTLFQAFKDSLDKGDAYLLKNHGGIVGGKSVMDAFYGIEELEESAKIACMVETDGVYEKIDQ
ncbi:MAG: class II aldolase/adducin family protein [Clostridiales bacterium]|nr:class II aldolase/adducin family protein [Clostridiales bacterium]